MTSCQQMGFQPAAVRGLFAQACEVLNQIVTLNA